MFNKFTFKLEESLIHNLIFEKKIKIDDLNNINYERLLKISSSHLIVPLIYSKFKKLNLIQNLEKDFRIFIKEIYDLNYSRNKELIKEIIEIEKIFKNEKIQYNLIKGAEFIKNSLYEDIGERMIGDIDILIDKKDSKKTTHILESIGFLKNKPNTKFWKKKHLPRFVSDEHIFAVEIHTDLFDYRKRKILSKNEFVKLINEDKYNLFSRLTILNFQINDFGYLRGSYSYRSIYDFNRLLRLHDVELSKYSKKKYYYSFLQNIEMMKKNKNEFIKIDNLYKVRFYLKRSSKFYYNFDNLICYIIEFFPKRLYQIIEIILNSEYRRYVIKKI